MIYNKSSHPIEVKKISLRLWTLRDEIEGAIGRRMKECEAAGIPLYIEDIKKFYNLNMSAPLTEQDNILPLHEKNPDPESMANLMESINEDATAAETPEAATEATPEAKPEETPEAAAAAPTVDAEGNPLPPASDSKTFDQAEAIIAEQTLAGHETKKPNPILDRPFQRAAPDLDRISYGFTLLSDINMEYLLSFTKNSFLQGQSVVVEFLIPQSFMMTADVVYCHHYALRSRIISSNKPDYRLQCLFSFKIPGERDTLRKFLKSIEPSLVIPQKKPKKDPEDDSLGL